MGKQRNKRGAKAPSATVVKANVRKDIADMATAVRRRIYHNPRGLTSAQILATMTSAAQTLLATFLADADMLNNDLNPASGSGQ